MFKNNIWGSVGLFSILSFASSVVSCATRDIPPHVHIDPIVYSKSLYDANIQKAILHQIGLLGKTDYYLYTALDHLAPTIRGKNVVVIGSYNAWYESILLAYGAIPTVIYSNPIETTDSRVTYLSEEDYRKNPQQFDLILSVLDTASEGLGKYGELIDPDGDLKSMENFKQMLNSNGKLLLAVPIGPDQLVWNDHRVYGEKRLKLLLKGWKVVRYYGFTSEYLFDGIDYSPVFMLQPKKTLGF